MTAPISKLPTGIPGFDAIADGGLPLGRTTLVAGTAGSAKTVFAAQFLAEGISAYGESGVFITFEESPEDLRNNFVSLGWDFERWEEEGLLRLVDASPHPDEQVVIGSYDLGALMARIEAAIRAVGAQRVSIDSIGSIFSHFNEASEVRQEILRIARTLRGFGVTTVLTAERTEEYGEVGRFGIEEFVADNVVVLRNILEEEKRRRTVEILKFRGTSHNKGEYPFTIMPDDGIVVIPVSAIELKQNSSNIRVTSGNTILDQMCDGGFFRDSIILVSGSTGTGKTLMSTEFIAGGLKDGERCLMFAFEESAEQLYRNAAGWGVDFAAAVREGQLMIICAYPETAGLEDHLVQIRQTIEDFKPDRVAVDSLSALERVGTRRGFREFVIALTSFVKHKETMGLFTSTTPHLLGGMSITEAQISAITDSIILLRYVEMFGEMRRGLTVLKMRGSTHDKDIREFRIDSSGMHIGAPFRNVAGILSGHTRHLLPGEIGPPDELFREQASGGLA